MSHSITLSSVDVAAQVASDHFALVAGNDVIVSPELETDRIRFESAYDTLPDESAVPSPFSKRYSWFTYLPWSNHLALRPLHAIPEDGATFSGIPSNLIANRFFRSLVESDFHLCPFLPAEKAQAVDVGIYMTRVRCKRGEEVTSRPSQLHQDGQRFVIIHLIQRTSIDGAESIVAGKDRKLLFQGILAQPLDTLVISDSEVFHTVTSLSCVEESEGFRDTLIVDFNPLVPKHSHAEFDEINY
jgi:hypothetical protein